MYWKNLVAAFKSRKQGKAGDRAKLRGQIFAGFLLSPFFKPEPRFLLFCSYVCLLNFIYMAVILPEMQISIGSVNPRVKNS